MPAKKALLHNYLMERKSHLIKQIENNNYQQWYYPLVNLLMINSNQIKNWYLESAWYFLWVLLK